MEYDLVIIGGGPAGVAAGVYAGRKKIKTALITDTFGGQSVVSADIQNFVGVPSISGIELATQMERHLRAQEGIDIMDGDRVSAINENTPGEFRIETINGKSIDTKTILFTAGSRRRKLGVPGEKEFDGKGVMYCGTCDAPLFGGKKVVVVGGGNAGLETVRDLIPYASEIYLFEHSGKVKGDPITFEKIRSDSKVHVKTQVQVTGITGEKMVEKIMYKDLSTGEDKEIEADGIFEEIGWIPNSDLLKDMVELSKKGEIIVDQKTQKTSKTGIWAAGDVTDGLYKQNNISMGDGVKAVLNIYEFLQ